MRTPTMTRIVARTGRSTLSGTRALRWLPKKMPGSEPMTSEPSSTQSTDPRRPGIGRLKLTRFRGVLAGLGDYGSVVSASMAAS
jgi:hypothetical protein